MNEDIDILLSRYFGGCASEHEQKLLDKWLAQSEENEAYFHEMTLVFQHSLNIASAPEPNMEKAFAAFSTHIECEKKSVQKTKKPLWKSGKFFLSVAASVSLLVGIFIWLPTHNADEHVVLTAETSTIQKNIFTGVEVVLSEGTALTYNPLNKKEITLTKGEATFKVHSQEDNDKLQVQVSSAIIEDIGTVFTVTAHNPEDSIMVEVAEGEILFYTKTNTGIRVKALERGVYYPKQDYFMLLSTEENIHAIEFRSTPLSAVTTILSKQYNVDITSNSTSLNELCISVTFDPNETIDTILHIIAETLSLRVTKKSDSEYVLSY
ncbi:MAG: FecR family protein [Bacteroidales bacterium]|jgi:ferric-dicitrate binding protein FerR (iron transport regulator)|nr:FecR family protein [Bacteroidales bacterium]